MAETATSSSEAVRDREEAKPAPAPTPQPEAPRSPFGEVADRIRATQADYLAARARQREALTANAQATAPLIQGAEQAIAARSALPPPPAPPRLAPAPTRKLNDFLAPVEGEAPENAVAKMIQGLGLMASSFGIGGKRDARAALASLSGAMKGWQEGDKERADRAFADWQDKTTSALKQWEAERKGYADIVGAADLAVEDKLKLLQLAKGKHEQKAMPEAHDAETLEKVIGWLEKEENQARQYELGVQRLEDMRLARADANAYKEMKLEIDRMKAEAAMKQVTDAVAALTPEAMESLGQQWALGKLPPGIARGKAGQTIMPKIINAGVAWAKKNNITLTDLPTVQAEVEAARKGMADTQKRMGVAEVAVGTFERHMTQLVELGKKVDRTGRPVVNRVLLKARGQYEGDADVAAYEAIALEAGQEFAKVSVGTAQGDANSREEARKAINSALSQAQLEKVAEELRKTARSRMAQYRDTLKRQSEIITTVGGRTGEGTHGDASPSGATMRIRRKSDGKLFEGPAGAVPDGYEKL